MSNLQPVRGTHDILPEECEEWRHVTEQCRVVASRYGFQEISTGNFYDYDPDENRNGEWESDKS